MDLRVLEVTKRNDIADIRSLAQQGINLYTFTTELHLASRFGQTEVARELVKLDPHLAGAKNIRGETPFHEACRKGNAEIVKLLLEADPGVASILNSMNKSGFSIACSMGHLDIVELLLNQRWFDIEVGIDPTCLHEAASTENTKIVRAILESRPNFASMTDKDGCVPLHYACQKSNLEITRTLLEYAPDSAKELNKNGYTPLHLAAIKGEPAMLEEFMSRTPTAFEYLTKNKQTVFHLAVKFGELNAFISMEKILTNSSHLLRQPDQHGNTVLHLAVCEANYDLSDYIINVAQVDINIRNNQGYTALDLIKRATVTSTTKLIRDMLLKSSDTKITEMPSLSSELVDTYLNNQNNVLNSTQLSLDPKLVEVHTSSTQDVRDSPEQKLERLQESAMNSRNDIANEPSNQHILEVGTNPVADTSHQVDEKSEIQDYTSELVSSSARIELHEKYKHQSQRRMKELRDLHRNHRNRQYKAHREALLSARNTIIIVAILIASVTFTVGLNPPGGVNQDGILKGQSTVSRKTAFKIFAICNGIALFTSLCIVIVLVSIIPFQRKKLMNLMVITHKVMWVSVSFMATAFVAASWLIMPQKSWVFDVLLAISAGSMTTLFVYLGIQLAKHWLRKLKWKKEKGKKRKTNDAVDKGTEAIIDIGGGIQFQSEKFSNEDDVQHVESSNSDVESSCSHGYHPY